MYIFRTYRGFINALIVLLFLSAILNVFLSWCIIQAAQIQDNLALLRVQALERKINSIQGDLTSHIEKFNLFTEKIEMLFVETTAYAPYDSRGSCNDGNPDTATGILPDEKTLAVDPKIFPYGTKFIFPGGELRIAKDTGGDMRQRTLAVSRGESQYYLVDRCVRTHEEAMREGRKILPVIIRRYEL